MTDFRMTRWTGVTDGGAVAPGAFMNTIFTASGSVVRGEADYASPGEAMGVSVSRTANVFGYVQADSLNAPSASVTIDFDQPPAPVSGQWRFLVAMGAGGERLWGLDVNSDGRVLFRNAAQSTIAAAGETAALVGVPKRVCVYWAKGTSTSNGTLRVRWIRLDTMATILDYALNTAQNVGTVNLGIIRLGPEFTSGPIGVDAWQGFGNVGVELDPGAVTDDAAAVAALVQTWPAEVVAYDEFYSANGSTLVAVTTHYSADGIALS